MNVRLCAIAIAILAMAMAPSAKAAEREKRKFWCSTTVRDMTYHAVVVATFNARGSGQSGYRARRTMRRDIDRFETHMNVLFSSFLDSEGRTEQVDFQCLSSRYSVGERSQMKATIDERRQHRAVHMYLWMDAPGIASVEADITRCQQNGRSRFTCKLWDLAHYLPTVDMITDLDGKAFDLTNYRVSLEKL